MIKTSAIVIAKNEEDRLADCLDSLSFCDEIIVVDGGSEDRTIDIARRMRAKAYKLETNDFSKLRNFGLERTSGEWILYIDADERVSEELKKEIIDVTSVYGRESKLNGYFLKRKNFYLGNHEWPYVEKLERLFKKKFLKGWKGRLHESPVVEGGVGELDGFLLHYTHRDLTSMLKKTIEWSKIEADLRFRAGHPKVTWWRLVRVMLTAFFDSYVRQKGWKARMLGFVESTFQLFSMFITYARLWELQQKKVKSEKLY